ncbi:MAG TPA: tyrosine--tRNA ligase [Bacteroidia bacterium]|nr:tyrosine--tRNA ligase [Bacteroidia bacterium]
MKTNIVEELRWRGMIHDIMPGTEELLLKESVTGYIGFDPTSDSLHIGSLAQIMLLTFFQRAGHKPIALVGGATGMIGDPSGKSEERNLLREDIIRYNEACIKKQLEKFLDFSSSYNPAEVLNNYDWFQDMTLLRFLREVGKSLTVNYMLAKDSVKGRIEGGMSFTEFNYQLMQAYDFLHLYNKKDCKLQMGGSDQWGNITSGVELIRKLSGPDAQGLTIPLVTKPDGSKFGKTETGNVWLDAKKTSPYKFYQFWLNVSDEEAKKYIRIFTLRGKEEIQLMEAEHDKAPHLRILQKELSKDVTMMVHSEKDFQLALEASEILFGKGTTESLKKLSEDLFLSVFEGVPQSNMSKSELQTGIGIIDFLSEKTGIFKSKGEARRTLQGGGISINKNKVDETATVSSADLLNGKYILAQKGKKDYFIVTAE